MGNINCNGEIQIFGENIFSKIYPIGSIYLSMNQTSPASLFGGIWEQLPENKALWTVTSGAGGTIEAGVPEITGRVHAVWGGKTFDHNPEASGGLVLGSQITQGSAAGSGWKMYLHDIQLNASRSNSIYGKSSTVQPPAIKIYAWKRIA